MTPEQRAARVHYHEYSGEGIREHAERIVALEELVTMLHKCASGSMRDLAPSCFRKDVDGCGMDCTDNGEDCCMVLLEQRMRELGVTE